MAAERRMIDAWVAAHLPGPDVNEQRADRLAAETLIIRKAIGRETPSLPPPWKDDVDPPILR
jgi:hypothetical protein